MVGALPVADLICWSVGGGGVEEPVLMGTALLAVHLMLPGVFARTQLVKLFNFAFVWNTSELSGAVRSWPAADF